MNKIENDLITKVSDGAPMGQMLQEWFWVPVARSKRLIAGDRPLRITLFGRHYVAFRGANGTVGFLDEACPHRSASLALGHVEGNGIRCIFHGWKMGCDGKLLEAPNEAVQPRRLAERVAARAHPVKEAGGLIWAYLGERSPAPDFPEFEFMRLPEEQVMVVSTPIACNWVQGLEAAVDSAHVQFLHRSHLPNLSGSGALTMQSAPVYEVEMKDFGFRAAAIRKLDDGNRYVRVSNFVMPWYGFTGVNDPDSCGLFIPVPVDDHNTVQWFVTYNLKRPVDPKSTMNLERVDFDNFAPVPGDASTVWGQDREAMARGHFTGFPENIIVEDMVVQVSMGSIVDRSKEHLTSSDLAVARLRRMLLSAVQQYQAGQPPLGATAGPDFSSVRSTCGIIDTEQRWQDLYAPTA